ncbi:phage head closure protein [Oceanobacillus salinisoli]|uniref:phage head closure protein n=1 Tax=Oceanobacillus salinisoli TaxID=2678611 RepID=UPI001E6098B9|nr:phage head closure protein [Oceanobacillus salinisoli]
MSINPGELNQRVIFQQPAGGTDADGFAITEPIPYTKAWAKLKTLKGSTFYAAAQNNMQHNREFTIRYQRKLDEDQRPENLQVVWKGKAHDIESIENDDGLNETMTVICKAVT